MPSYDYIHRESGAKLTLIRSVEERDKPVVFERVTVPERIAIAGSAADPFDAATQVLNGYKKLEERGQLGNLGGFTPEQIKRAWSEPDPVPSSEPSTGSGPGRVVV